LGLRRAFPYSKNVCNPGGEGLEPMMSTGVLYTRPTSLAARRKKRTPYIPRRVEPLAPTTVVFVRPGHYEFMDKVLVGRMPDIPLSPEGLDQAHTIAQRLSSHGISRVHSSPRQRALETATIVARTAQVPLEISFSLDEVDFGAWTGMSFEDLAADGTWNFWTMLRSVARPPEGETMREVQDRVLRYLARAHKNHPGERIVVVTHLEVIRAAVLACQGRSLDAYAEVSVAPSGVVEVTLSDEGAQLVVEAAG